MLHGEWGYLGGSVQGEGGLWIWGVFYEEVRWGQGVYQRKKNCSSWPTLKCFAITDRDNESQTDKTTDRITELQIASFAYTGGL